MTRVTIASTLRSGDGSAAERSETTGPADVAMVAARLWGVAALERLDDPDAYVEHVARQQGEHYAAPDEVVVQAMHDAV